MQQKKNKNGYVIIAMIDIDPKKEFVLLIYPGAFSEIPFSAKGPLSRMCRTYLETGSGTDR